MQRQQLLKRLAFLRNMEAFNVFFLPLCLHLVIGDRHLPHAWFYWSAMALICYILLQGTYYWHLKYRAVAGKTRQLPRHFSAFFRFCQRSNVILFVLYPLLVVWALISQQVRGLAVVGPTLLYLFAILEHINYFHRQLMHDNGNDLRYLFQHRRLRPAPLATDLANTQL